MRLIAHRGGAALGPENTLAAVRRSLAVGAAWLEVDIYVVEGQLLVFHDERLERTTNGSGRLLDHSLAQLRALDAGVGEPIPLLQEVLATAAGRAGLNIEIKGRGCAAPLAALLHQEVAEGRWRWDELLVSSFAPEELRAVRALLPLLPLGLLYEAPAPDWREQAAALGARSLHIALPHVDRALVEAVHRAGLNLLVYTVNTADDLARLAQLGVDGVFSDYPDGPPSPHP